MFNPLEGDVIPLRQAARLLPHLKNGRPVHVSTLFRWARKGVRGVHLETIRVGGITVTSRKALTAFVAALSGLPVPETQSPSEDLRNRQIEEELARKFRL